MHKPAQVELQLDRPQLPYSETLVPIIAEAAQPITAGGSPILPEKAPTGGSLILPQEAAQLVRLVSKLCLVCQEHAYGRQNVVLVLCFYCRRNFSLVSTVKGTFLQFLP